MTRSRSVAIPLLAYTNAFVVTIIGACSIVVEESICACVDTAVWWVIGIIEILKW